MIAYFIGGSQDLTKRVFKETPMPYLRFPLMGPIGAYKPSGDPVFIKVLTEEYRGTRISKDVMVYQIEDTL